MFILYFLHSLYILICHFYVEKMDKFCSFVLNAKKSWDFSLFNIHDCRLIEIGLVKLKGLQFSNYITNKHVQIKK